MKFRYAGQSLFVLLTLPAGIAFSIGALAPLFVILERYFATGKLSPFILQFEAESARAVLSTIAGGAMTALSLTYSLVLVVFTLAAGNIGPRLLKRFTSELVNQVTAGIFGGTFLYAVGTLYFIQQDFVPKITVFMAGVLAILSVMQLIYFVRHVSQSITIDDEIAEITNTLITTLRQLHDTNEDKQEIPDTLAFNAEIPIGSTGYIGSIARDTLLRIADKNDLVIKINKQTGSFVLANEPCILLSREVDEAVRGEICSCLSIERSRSSGGTVEFSINLLVEISLRALSPGVNDTFTAIAAVDSMSSAFSEVANMQLDQICVVNDDGVVRVILANESLKEMFGGAFHPLRRASRSNILMSQSLARVYSRLFLSGSKNVKDIMRKHATLLMRDIQESDFLEEDIASVREIMPQDLLSASNE